MVVKIIHQTYSSDNIPEVWSSSKDSWEKVSQELGFEYKFWTDEQNHQFVEENYPGLLMLYENYEVGVQRSHMMRYLYMHHFGGLYVDMNISAKQHTMEVLDPMLKLYQLVFLRDDIGEISTKFIYSEKGHPFWDSVIQNLEDDIASDHLMTKAFRHFSVKKRTGSSFLTACYTEYQDKSGVNILPDEWVSSGDVSIMKEVEGGPTWHEWDSNILEHGKSLWKYMNYVLVTIIVVLILILILMVVFRK